jgi:FXSXX-COOH protein
LQSQPDLSWRDVMMPDLSRVSLGELPALGDEVIGNALDRLLEEPGSLFWQNYACPESNDADVRPRRIVRKRVF